MKAETTPSGRIYQDSNFVVSEFADAILEGLIGMEDQIDREPLIVFVKIKDKNWNRYFLNGAIGFWENWQETEVDQSEAHIDEVVYVDYMDKYALHDKTIKTVECKNAQISLTFTDGSQFILKEVAPENPDSASEVLYIAP
ncbi:hypothetical protein [Flavobacterium sp. NKUCC04_CG]|uniref:hypothetical protein n=1 Tax=Flavobacterium sp. NKUCC04_CG TaxID=2842121 RepID=UPI001C5AAB94|nr:hypothetical protein [Flavobacterium sp. NKUCC04_CG]MBW3518772.1 hypothetical protein [Flavobacterium sp. NKUCC04_CG]